MAAITGLVPVPFPLTGDDVLTETRYTDYRFELLNNQDEQIGILDGVQAGGSVDFTATAAVKGGGKITVSDVGQEIDWLNVRIKPYIILNTEVGQTDGEEFPAGVYIATAPVEEWVGGQRFWNVELLDKLAILDQDIPTDEATGTPITFAVESGSVVIDEVKALIESTGATAEKILPNDKTLSDPMTWAVGTTKLKIINDMLAAANFFSLWCDFDGEYRTEPYVRPFDREVKYEALDPFSKSIKSLMFPDWESDNDIYSIPNRYVAIGRGTADTEAPVGVAVNNDPASPYSFASRGRWITEVVTGVEAASQDDLDEIAARGLADATSVSQTVSISHAYLPDLHVNDVVRFSNPDAEVDVLATIVMTEIVFDPLALCRSELRAI